MVKKRIIPIKRQLIISNHEDKKHQMELGVLRIVIRMALLMVRKLERNQSIGADSDNEGVSDGQEAMEPIH
jgi:hypothetical protein